MTTVAEKQVPQKTHPLSRPTKDTHSSCHCQSKFPDLRPQGSMSDGSRSGQGRGGGGQQRKAIFIIITK